MPDPDKQGDCSKNQERQREGQSILKPIGESLVASLMEEGSGLTGQCRLGITGGRDLGMRSGISRAGLVNGAERTGQLTRQIAAVPCLGIDFLKVTEMLREGILNGIKLFKATLGLLGFTLDQNDGSTELVGDLVASSLQLLLAPRQLLKTLLFLLDQILTLAELQQL